MNFTISRWSQKLNVMKARSFAPGGVLAAKKRGLS
jgi:hypothetical protein